MSTETQKVDVLAVRYYVSETQCATEFEAVSTGDLMGLPVFMEVPGDPVLGGKFQYVDGGWEWMSPCPNRPFPANSTRLNAPECVAGCSWVMTFQHDRQRNALRMETGSLVQPERCGWNLLPNRLGGHPLDYAPCTRAALARVGGAK